MIRIGATLLQAALDSWRSGALARSEIAEAQEAFNRRWALKTENQKFVPGGVIYNGDHLAFEQEWAGVEPQKRPDWPWPSFDPADWALAFREAAILSKDRLKIDRAECERDGWVSAWFANAMMRGYDEAELHLTGPYREAVERLDAMQRRATVALCIGVATAAISLMGLLGLFR
jgi:hypothetical protein